jgi:uncharacterized protein YggE
MEETKHILDISDRAYKLIVTVIVVAAVFLAGFLANKFQELPQNLPHEIFVSGEGRTYAKPDIAKVSLGVQTKGFKSQEVVIQNNEKMNAIIKSIKELEVKEKDIQTTVYSLNPVYDYTENGRIFRGYSLDQQIEVKIRNFDNIGAVLDKAGAGGANIIGDLNFTVDDMEKLRSEARAKAIAQAKEKANNLIGQAGLKIKKLVNISEGYSPTPIFLQQGYGSSMMEKSNVPQIEAGQMEINMTVTLTYSVR